MTEKRVTIIAAHSPHGVIGRAGAIPWHVPSDLTRFKRLTMGHDVIVGRTTFESILRHNNGKLPGGRHFIVLSRRRTFEYSAYTTAVTPEEALFLANRSNEVFVAGGAQVYGEMFPYANRLHLTEIGVDVEGDTYLPEWSMSGWQLCHTMVTMMHNEPEVTHRTWERKDAGAGT